MGGSRLLSRFHAKASPDRNRIRREIADPKTRKRLRRIDASVFREPRSFRLLNGDLGLLGGEFALHYVAATTGQVGPILHHAGGDLRNVGDFRAAEAEGIARALRLGLG